MNILEIKINGQSARITKDLMKKYEVSGPRYTSYPTYPQWKPWTAQDFQNELNDSNREKRPLSLYFHIPFCDKRCTFCACNTIATKHHRVVADYLEALKTEIKKTSNLIDLSRRVDQIHFGGGTPTYFSPEELKELYEETMKYFSPSPDAEINIEVDPRVTTEKHLKVLSRLGFNRISLGVQDFNPAVQKAIGRIQPKELTESLIKDARKSGFVSVNCDLVYGLPKQTPDTFKKTLKSLIDLNPDRVSLFNFAYVPWLMPHQQKIDKKTLPDSWNKLKLFCEAIKTFQDNGYFFIGLDHFAKKDDELVKAFQDGTLYRNFQGYSTKAGCDVIGFGMTGISQFENFFSQNEKNLKKYEDKIKKDGFAANCGLVLSEDDKIRRWVIGEIFCHLRIDKNGFQKLFKSEFDNYFKDKKRDLDSLQKDNLIQNKSDSLSVTATGRFFLRNIAMTFDAYLTNTNSGQRFSKVI